MVRTKFVPHRTTAASRDVLGDAAAARGARRRCDVCGRRGCGLALNPDRCPTHLAPSRPDIPVRSHVAGISDPVGSRRISSQVRTGPLRPAATRRGRSRSTLTDGTATRRCSSSSRPRVRHIPGLSLSVYARHFHQCCVLKKIDGNSRIKRSACGAWRAHGLLTARVAIVTFRNFRFLAKKRALSRSLSRNLRVRIHRHA